MVVVRQQDAAKSPLLRIAKDDFSGPIVCVVASQNVELDSSAEADAVFHPLLPRDEGCPRPYGRSQPTLVDGRDRLHVVLRAAPFLPSFSIEGQGRPMP